MNFSEADIIAILGLLGTAVINIIGLITASKLVNYRLQQLEKKVDLHNNIVIRMTAAEVRLDNADDNLKQVCARIQKEGF